MPILDKKGEIQRISPFEGNNLITTFEFTPRLSVWPRTP